jgi:hypothetical protein
MTKNGRSAPSLSFVVVVYDMPDQARRTLHSLSPAYQREARADDYEVVVVENASPRLLGRDAALASGPNVRYFLRERPEPSPVPAINFGAAQSAGAMLGVMIDGARLLTPGIVALALKAQRLSSDAVLSIPGYHLGDQPQQTAAAAGYDEAAEARLLERIGWPQDGYRLFEIACFSASCADGFFLPIAESNCLCLPRALFEDLGGFDDGFRLPGGGFSNLDFYARACDHPRSELYLAPGEGTFHQFHGGITTSGDPNRDRVMSDFTDEYRALRGGAFVKPAREPAFLGAIPGAAGGFVRISVEHYAAASAEKEPSPVG